MSDNKTQAAGQVQTPEKKVTTEESTRLARRGIKTGIKAGRNMCW